MHVNPNREKVGSSRVWCKRSGGRTFIVLEAGEKACLPKWCPVVKFKRTHYLHKERRTWSNYITSMKEKEDRLGPTAASVTVVKRHSEGYGSNLNVNV